MLRQNLHLPGALLMTLIAGTWVASCGTTDPKSTPIPPAPACAAYDPSTPTKTPGPFTVVHIEPGLTPAMTLAVQACAGLHNRKAGGSVYIDADPHDLTWLKDLGAVPTKTVDPQQFLTSCITEFPACVRYDYTNQQKLLPNILTVASALDAVPVDGSMNVACDKPAFDAIAEFADKSTPALSTQYVFDKYGAQTTGLAMLNPGYEIDPVDTAAPNITQPMKPALVDFVFSQKLFVVFLVNGCIDGNPEKEVLSNIVNAGNWKTPVGVYGYNNSWLVGGGYLYEAQTRCLDSRNMGAIASEAGNLSFFSTRTSPITGSGKVVPNALEDLTYDPNKTYVAFVVGDGDNIQYMLTTRHDWFEQRVADCEATPDLCPPLSWSVSPHLTALAPEVLDWYYKQSHRTGKDYFVLPPSGHLYAYPSSLAEDAQNSFVKATEEDACILGLSGVVHWDWLDSWRDAEDHFLPKYAKEGGAIRGVFPMNVPYPFPAFPEWSEDQFFKVLSGADGGNVALFKPRSWRGINKDTDKHFLSPEKMAEEISGYPKGTVTWVYMTSDGGLTLQNAFLALAKLLPPHVELVSTDTAAKLAIAAKKN